MNNQDIYNKVRDHLLMQGQKSIEADGTFCLYRTPDGLKCAAGCLIADEHYKPELERKTADMCEVRDALRLSGVPETAMELVRELQELHDYNSPLHWKKDLEDLAKRWSLTP